MVKPEELEALLLVARKHGVRKLSVGARSGAPHIEVELEPQLAPLSFALPAQPAQAEPDADETDPLFDAVEG